MTRRDFASLWTVAAGMAVVPATAVGGTGTATLAEQAGQGLSLPPSTPAPDETQLRSEILVDLLFEKGSATNIGSVGMNRVIVPVTGGSFEGPRLKGIIIGPSGDWMSLRSDGSSILDLRLILETDDQAKILMVSRGIAYTQPGGSLYARILPAFETSAAKYLWLNDVVAVGVYRAVPGKVAYRVFNIL